MAMKKEDKLTKQRVIDDVMAIIRPPQEKKNGNNRGAALIQAMLAKAKEGTPRQTLGGQPQQRRQIPRPPTTPPPITPTG